MTKKENLLKKLTVAQKNALVNHFNTIYECTELSETENNIIFLAWLWKEGHVFQFEDGGHLFDELVAGVPLTDYEVTFEADYSGGVNLTLFYEYYDIKKIIEIMGWGK